MTAENIITVDHLNFDYGNKRILRDVTFAIPQGAVTALVGPNGAGKTTLLRCLTALAQPSSGDIRVDGHDVFDNPRLAHASVGYLSDFFGVYDDLTVRQCLTYMAGCHGLPEASIPARVQDVATLTDIADRMEQKAGTLSRGYRQRLGIGFALVHNPKIVILDEPASGMDPEARIGLSSLMLALKKQGKTVLVSSHILSELEDYCSDMLVLRAGTVAEHITLNAVRKDISILIKVSLEGAVDQHLSYFNALQGASDMSVTGQDITFRFQDGQAGQNQLLRRLMQDGLPITDFTRVDDTLSGAYMNIAKNAKKVGPQP